MMTGFEGDRLVITTRAGRVCDECKAKTALSTTGDPMSQAAVIQAVEQSQVKDNLPRLNVGDTVDVHVRIVEGSKERIQVFSGVIIKMKGQGLNRSITVRRIVANEGVERTFKIHSPKIATIETKRHGHVRRAKLYYLRERVGKKRRLRDRRRGLANLAEGATAAPESDAKSEQPAEAAATPADSTPDA